MLSFVSSPSTFLVEEVPAYSPSGTGSHTFVWIEKKGLTTFDAIRRLGDACGVSPRDIGYAGMKDRHATTRQWLSVPNVDPEALPAFEGDDLRVLEARRHPHKLRLGHVRANRFEVVLQGEADEQELAGLAERLATLARDGLPNRYGDQRFGATGENAARGLAILRGELKERDQRRRRLLVSAAQSAVFNAYLELRARGGLKTVREGDVLQKTDTGGLFVSAEVAIDQSRVDAGAVVPTGPMPGARVMEPPAGSPSRALEEQALAAAGAAEGDFDRLGRELPGTRRPVVVPVTLGEPALARNDAGAPVLRFTLPAGSYATVLIEALALGADGASPA